MSPAKEKKSGSRKPDIAFAGEAVFSNITKKFLILPSIDELVALSITKARKTSHNEESVHGGKAIAVMITQRIEIVARKRWSEAPTSSNPSFVGSGCCITSIVVFMRFEVDDDSLPLKNYQPQDELPDSGSITSC